MTLTKPKLIEMANLVHDLRQQLYLFLEKFVAKLGISFKTVNRWQWEYIVPSPMAMKLIEDLLRSLGEPGKALLKQYFPGEELDV